MLTGLRLGNFKAFGETQHIPIKPLTLIFGANSAGKSSIIHGLLLAHHASETGDLDVHQMQIGGEAVDLGGFKQYVHRRNDVACFTWGTKINGLELSYPLYYHQDPTYHQEPVSFTKDGSINLVLSIVQTPSSAESLYGGYHMHIAESAAVKACDVEVGGEPLLRFSRNKSDIFILESLNGNHPFLRELLKFVYLDDEWGGTNREAAYEQVLDTNFVHVAEDFKLIKTSFLFPYRDSKTRLVSIRELEEMQRGFGDLDDYEDNPFLTDEEKFSTLQQMARRLLVFLAEFIDLVEDKVNFQLTQLKYLGPLRSYPSRHLAFPDMKAPNWFAGGAYTWEMVRTDERVRTKINKWLGERLKTPYELLVRRYVSQDNSSDAIEELLLRDKRFSTLVSHRDIGMGISQVLPVLVSAYGSHGGIIAIEQPEIHLHPALQAELADVFIESALGQSSHILNNTFLLETHSEHLILRIMRRMRDTVRSTLPEGMPPIRPKDVAVLYVGRKDDDSTSVVTELALDEEGQLLDPWPGGFFEEGYNERFA